MTTSSDLPVMLDVRTLSKVIGVEPIELVRLLQDDAVPLLKLGPKRWRIEQAAWLGWFQLRQQKAAEDAQQRRLRMGHVAGKSHSDVGKLPRVKFARR